jgi:hypothetical protein
MAVFMGSGDYTFRVEDNWPKLPPDLVLGDVSAVAVDDKDRVYLFNRGPNPMVIVDRAGNFLDTWGQNVFKDAHGVYVGPDGYIYCTDWGDHTVRRCTPDGKVLMTLGTPNEPAPYMSGRPFNRCTQTVLSPDMDYLYVTDGYGNAKVHKFTRDGKYVTSWGESGSGPGEFNLPHAICCDKNGFFYVADRENHRIQIFDGDGRFETQINNLHRPGGLYLMESAGETICYIGELGPFYSFNRRAPNLGPRISIMTPDGKLLGRLAGDPPYGNAPGQFLSTHSVALDSRGNIYVGQVGMNSWPALFPGEPIPEDLCQVRKLVRVNAGAGAA